MNKIFFWIIIFIFVITVPVFASSKIQKIDIHIEFDSTYRKIPKIDFNRINIKINNLNNLKKYQIGAIIASRPGVQLNYVLSGSSSTIETLYDINLTQKTFVNYNFLLMSFKYLPGNNNIPDFTINKDISNNPNAVYHGEKTRQSFAFGFSSNNRWTWEGLSYKQGLATGIGLIFDKRVHHYTVGTDNFGTNDTDVHFYFEVEPQWETGDFIIGLNYNSYFHQFGCTLNYKF